MAFLSLNRFSPLISLLIQLLFILTSDFFARTNGSPVLENVCRQTKDPSLCLAYLRPEPRSESASLSQLAQITIDKAQFDGVGTKTKIHALLLSSFKNPGLHKLYSSCEGFYDDALDALTIAPQFLSKGQYGKLEANGAIISNSGVRCENLFKGKSPFTEGNKELEILGNVIAVIAQDISRGV